MSGIAQHIIFAVTRVRAEFTDSIGNAFPPVLGTGFFLETAEARTVLVTNRHNIDPRMSLGAETGYRLTRLEVELRAVTATSEPIRDAAEVAGPETRFFEVGQLGATVFLSSDADCALVVDPVWVRREEPYAAMALFKEDDLADEAHFREHVRVMDAASFLGFPGSRGRNWWDEQWRLPIVRPASIASWPAVPFTNESIRTTDTLLVAGHSFTGSSGSPVVTHAKSLSSTYVPSRTIGIMSGHFQEKVEDTPEMFRHSGLSYLTRSTSIIALLAEARAAGFRRAAPSEGFSSAAE
jgi:hypothetical protein